MRGIFILAGALVLAGCDGPGLSDKQRDEVEDIADDVAADHSSGSGRVDELEAQVMDLESRNSQLEDDVESLKQSVSDLEAGAY